MDELITFLRARLDEDNEVGRATRKNEQFVHGTDRWFASHGSAITSMAPHRAVAEVEAKRRILDKHKPGRYGECEVCDVGAQSCGCCGWGDYPCDTVRLLALPYAEHSDYREEWRL